MKNIVLAAAIATALSSVPMGAFAASPNSDVAQIREQLEGLMKRVDKLEQENTELKQENEALKATDEKLQANDDYLKTEARGLRKETAQQAVEVAKTKGTDWASKVAITGDMRYRYEYISDDTLSSPTGVPAADRYRDRIRARLAVTAKPTDNITVGIGMTTTEGSDPRSGNQSLKDVFTKKAFDLDLAYFDWKFASWGNLIGGKMKQPFVKPGQSLFWDNDITPEGLALGFQSGMFFGTAYNYWLLENSGAENTRTADTMLHGAQLGMRLPMGSASSLMLEAHYYDLSAAQGRAAVYNNNSNNNTFDTIVVSGVNTTVLRYDYEVISVGAEFSTLFGALPFTVWAEGAQNQDVSDEDTAWGVGFLFGKASNNRTWEAGVGYQKVEKDALYAQLIDSDFAGGFSDNEGFVFRGAYTPVKNWTLNATYFLNKRNAELANSGLQTDVDYDRLQLDFNVKF
ncbi:putative porin [Steroidobacter flavus]|uniref:Porin n=1 Tax=Steroidobacter flavus TaxID=1842136 RepID=A0ABV8SXD7_9GAMM